MHVVRSRKTWESPNRRKSIRAFQLSDNIRRAIEGVFVYGSAESSVTPCLHCFFAAPLNWGGTSTAAIRMN